MEPAGKPAVDTPDPLTMQAFFAGGFDKHRAGFVAVEAPETITVATRGWFIGLFLHCHTPSLPIQKRTRRAPQNLFIVLIKVPGKGVQQFCS
jgi:hypothetical protein